MRRASPWERPRTAGPSWLRELLVFVLTIEVYPEARALSLRLADRHGRHLGANQVRLDDHPPRAWESIFDARGYVRRFAGIARRAGSSAPLSIPEIEARIGAFIGRVVLGPAIMGALSSGITQRELIVRLPDPGLGALAGALARVPWEMARPARGEEPEGEPLIARNVVSRAVLSGASPPSQEQPGEEAVALAPNEPLRVLLVYAEAPLSRPLAARQEREQLVSLFAAEVMPKKSVIVDALCHGVTRERLRDRIQSAGGYHVVHWSGHGEQDALELARMRGGGDVTLEKDIVTGAELVSIFASAGGFIPNLFFLSACHSGSFTDPSEWAALQATLRDKEAALDADIREEGPDLSDILGAGRGRAGTALEVCRAGVPAVVAMRFEVGDAYARELAVRFYRRLFAQQRPHPVGASLAMARAELAKASEHHPLDHATPFCIGAAPIRFEAAPKRSAQLDRLRPRPQPLLRGRRDLDPPPVFHGRGAELAALSSAWLEPGGAVIALIEGAAGVGKTALAAEMIHLWHTSFDWVFVVQASEPMPLISAVYKQIDERLTRASPAYRERCANNELARVFAEPSGDFEDAGGAGSDLLRENLADAMLAERILLVLDAIPGAPLWEDWLRSLSERLLVSGSRLIVTSRLGFSDAFAAAKQVFRVPLGIYAT